MTYQTIFTTFLRPFMDHYALCTHSSQIPSINIHQSFTISHFIILHFLLLFSSTMCFHCWPFIRKGYSSILGIVWTIKGHGAALQICTICLGVWLDIKVSIVLERKQILPQAHSLTILFSFLLHLLVPQV